MNLKQLAEHLQLSQTTVSRALNGYPEVSERTRQRVTEAATRLHYAPSQHARRLARGVSNTIGHFIPTSQQALIGPHFADLMAGASEAAASRGYELLLSMVSDDRETNFYRELAQSRRVDGVVVHGPLVDDPRIRMLRDLKVPFLVHGRSQNTDVNYAWMDVNNLRAVRRATEFLLDLGHTDIALLNGREDLNYAARRRLGYEQALIDSGLAIQTRRCFADELTEAYGYNAGRQLLEDDNPPTAIVCSGILPAYGVLRAIQSLGLTLARDVSVVTYDDQLSYVENTGDVPLFTSMRSSIRDAGARLINLLINHIEQPEEPMPQELWEVELVVGLSTGRR